MLPSDRYVWLIWSSAFLVPWGVLCLIAPVHRAVMWKTSWLTSLFGLTEPLFVPAYWNPPSLFNLAQRIGFDIESEIFCFAIGGVGAVLYNALTARTLLPVPASERHQRRHRFHRVALATPFAVFLGGYFFPWNPIYPAILAMLAGALSAVLCRPDLGCKTLVGGVMFMLFYLVFLVGLESLSPGYIGRVWNLSALSGVLLGPYPIEELLFGLSFGLFWTGVYEHVSWRKAQPDHQEIPVQPKQ